MSNGVTKSDVAQPTEPATALAPHPGGIPSWVATLLILALLIVVTGAWFAWQWPTAMDFKFFAFYDAGAALKADALLAMGLRPTVDFAYSYGLLPLLLGRGWFAVFGRTPLAYELLTLACTLALLLAVVRWAQVQRWPAWAVLSFAALIPCGIMVRHLNQTHAIEAALLMWALALHAGGRRKWALALVTACVFVKPSMAYVYGFLLVGLIVAEWVKGREQRGTTTDPSRRFSALLREFAPAAAVGVALFLLLRAVYGWDALAGSLWPANAGRSYRAANFGFFFGVGRTFWLRPNGDYFTSPAAYWLISTAVMAAVALVVLLAALRRRLPSATATVQAVPTDPAREAFVCLVLLHAVFILFLYAWWDSWTYYSYLPAVGIVTALVLIARQLPPRQVWTVRIAAAALAVIALVGLAHHPFCPPWPWDKTLSPETAGLWAYDIERDEWTAARQALAAGSSRTAPGKTLLLANGFADGLFPPNGTGEPKIEMPRTWFMSPALNTPGELERVRRQIAAADIVVRFNELGPQRDPWNWKEFAAETTQFRVESMGNYFTVMVRDKPATREPPAAPTRP